MISRQCHASCRHGSVQAQVQQLVHRVRRVRRRRGGARARMRACQNAGGGASRRAVPGASVRCRASTHTWATSLLIQAPLSGAAAPTPSNTVMLLKHAATQPQPHVSRDKHDVSNVPFLAAFQLLILCCYGSGLAGLAGGGQQGAGAGTGAGEDGCWRCLCVGGGTAAEDAGAGDKGAR